MTDSLHGALISVLFLLVASLAHAMKKHRRQIESIEAMIKKQSEQSARYKVGDKVKFVDEDCVVIGVTETLTGRYRYNISRNGVCIAVGVTENMLDPADEDAQ